MAQLSIDIQRGSGFLDQPDFRRIYCSLRNPNSMRFHVAGIKCSKCVQKLENLPQKMEGLVDLRVNISNGIATVQVDPNCGSFARVAEAIYQLGFIPSPVENETQEELAQKKEDRRELIRLGVVGACAGNIMTFSFANYFGQVGPGALLMNYVSLFLFLPVLLYGAIPFYRGAWQALGDKTISVDTPITVAFVFGSLCSMWSLFTHRDLIYFDSLSGFLFLILLSRWFQKRLQRHFLGKMQTLSGTGVLKTRRKIQNEWVVVPSVVLKAGDWVQICEGEIVPADIQLKSDGGLFDFSFLTGESMPRPFTKGMRIPAGTRSLSSHFVEAEVLESSDRSEFSKLMSQIREGALHKVKVMNLADRAARILLITVFVVAGLFLVTYWQVDPEQAIARSLALVILACPCALAFGTPLTLGFALKKAVENGVLIKSADVFTKLNEVHNIYLDKTGTITTNRFRVLRTEPKLLSPEIVQIILQLEVLSHHPIAFAIRDFFSSRLNEIRGLPSLEFDDHVETLGIGVAGLYQGRFFELKKVNGFQSEKRVGLFRDGVLICEIFLLEEILPHTEKSILSLTKMGHTISLLSGDKSYFVYDLGRQLGIDENKCFGDLSPVEKAELVSRAGRGSMMVGDGVNDALALQKADIGVAVRGSVEVALRTADVYLLQSGIEAVPLLFQLSQRVKEMLRRNITISLVYNSAGGIAALLGWVNPFVAALLMPMSSGIILLNAWWESKR